MLSKDDLKRIVEDESNLSKYEKMGKLATKKRGEIYYGKLKKLYPFHYKAYRIAIKKTFIKKSNNIDDFIDFIIKLGEIPKGITKPTMILIKGNLSWLENDKRKLRKSYRHLKKNKKISTMECRQRLIDFLENNCNKKIYINNKLLLDIGYSSFYTLNRSLQKLEYKINTDSYGYFIETK